MSVLVYVEQVDGKFKKSVFEAVSYAKAIADKTGTSLTAVSIGNVADSELQELGKYGAAKVLNVASAELKNFVNQAYALAPRVAVKLKAGLVDGAVELPQLDGGKFLVKKGAFSGKAFAVTELTSAIKVIALNPNAFGVKESAVTAAIESFSPAVQSTDLAAIVKEIVRATDKISLPDAELVVSAGRGLKGPENWGMIEELANLLGAATACSKPVSDADWRPHSEHVGQTGIAISPNLYIAIGISGAIQHLAGVSSSKVIVVINKDPEAPFFKVADYGIVGDAFEVVPKLIEALKAHQA